MKSIDFTQPGGFPLTQDQLDYLQQSYTETIRTVAAIGDDGTGAPVLLAGMAQSISGGTTTITPGWFLYNSDLVYFTGASYGTVPVGDVPLVTISTSVGTLTFNNGTTPGVILEKTAGITLAPTATDATHFPFSSLQPFGTGFGKNNREQTWSSIVVNTAAGVGGVTGTIYYKKDFTANTLHIRGSLAANNAQNFAASPFTLFYTMGTLPPGYIPNNPNYFIGQYYVATSIQDDAGVAWIKQVNCVVNTTGQILINWLKPTASLAYGINFNTIISLD
jgi:hypothetical protein